MKCGGEGGLSGGRGGRMNGEKVERNRDTRSSGYASGLVAEIIHCSALESSASNA